jgi:hypothetical protein
MTQQQYDDIVKPGESHPGDQQAIADMVHLSAEDVDDVLAGAGYYPPSRQGDVEPVTGHDLSPSGSPAAKRQRSISPQPCQATAAQAASSTSGARAPMSDWGRSEARQYFGEGGLTMSRPVADSISEWIDGSARAPAALAQEIVEQVGSLWIANDLRDYINGRRRFSTPIVASMQQWLGL